MELVQNKIKVVSPVLSQERQCLDLAFDELIFRPVAHIRDCNFGQLDSEELRDVKVALVENVVAKV